MCKAFPKGIQGGNGEIWEAVGSWCKSDKQKEEQVGEGFLDFCSVSGRSIKTQEPVRQSQTLQGPESARMDLPLSSTLSLTRHSLWEVWPWLTCSHELESIAAGFQVEDDPCCGRSARHRLRAATSRTTLDPELKWKPREDSPLELCHESISS